MSRVENDLYIENLSAMTSLDGEICHINIDSPIFNAYACQLLNISQAIKLRDFLNEFIEANNEK